ncbi:flavin-containing monooxygenase [Pseudohalioglobus lutimaris]|uniref:NAD(P)/FAD-dependent oxidoreductase n=1 Tax=Pseudohalioglobus lutimaris TaxID=1737061 RepID=A0A2N5X861_9GAMM|nr:NAD(P)/FAD-dependent oxidoreductase [Pseudohalioglobus lutimaris]PLW70669.1 NAD(P)/FAD-dependent oxidoreductase [Pseudohalioglobus lutimaris]
MAYDWHKTLSEVDDKQLCAALEQAAIPALLASMLHLTGNTAHFDQVQPRFELMAEDPDGLTEAQRAIARELAFAALQRYRNGAELAQPTAADIETTMHRITGEDIPADLMPMLREELNLFGEDARRVHIDTTSMATDFRVVIIGSGMSGIVAAIRLQQEGIPFLILEKNPEIGGTWFENTYPGCQVDSANHLYNYIFEPNTQWPNHFSGQGELLKYFNQVVAKYQLREHVRLNCPVQRADYDEVSGKWTVTVDGEHGVEKLSANAVISAVGQLNIPRYPDIAGAGNFQGISFHSARWEHQHDLAGKRVAVIGTGCSAVQFVPEIAGACANVDVFQRSAPWLLPVPEYHAAMTEEELWLLRELPFYARWYRFFLFRARAIDGELPFLFTEPGWDGPANTVSASNQMLRDALIESLAEQVGDDADLLEKLIPDYPPGGKRPVLDDGSYITALKREEVSVHTDPIDRIVEQGIVTADGTLHEIDVLIYGTGFAADQFLSTLQVYGREGRELVSSWDGDAHAYKGVMVPDFPNFYTLYGPNTNIVVGSSIVFFVECQMRYISGCIKLQIEQGARTLECRRDLTDAYNARIDELNSQRAWGAPVVSSWYKNSKGRVTQNWPGTHGEFWQQLRAPEPGELVISTRREVVADNMDTVQK